MSLKNNNQSVAAQNQKTEITASSIKKVRESDSDKKVTAKKKGGFVAGLKRMGRGIAKWFRELKSELKKIVWPGRKSVFKNTVVVIAVILIVGLAVWIMDAVCEYVILKGLLKLIAG